MCLPAAQCITHHSDGLGAALGKASQLMSDEVCAAADAAYLALAALVGMCSSVLLCSPHIFVPFAHAALVAHRLGGVDDAAVDLCITVLSDLQ